MAKVGCDDNRWHFYKQIRRDQDDDNDKDNDRDADAFEKAESNNALTTKTGIPGGRGAEDAEREGGRRFEDGKTRLETALSVGLTERPTQTLLRLWTTEQNTRLPETLTLLPTTEYNRPMTRHSRTSFDIIHVERRAGRRRRRRGGERPRLK